MQSPVVFSRTENGATHKLHVNNVLCYVALNIKNKTDAEALIENCDKYYKRKAILEAAKITSVEIHELEPSQQSQPINCKIKKVDLLKIIIENIKKLDLEFCIFATTDPSDVPQIQKCCKDCDGSILDNSLDITTDTSTNERVGSIEKEISEIKNLGLAEMKNDISMIKNLLKELQNKTKNRQSYSLVAKQPALTTNRIERTRSTAVNTNNYKDKQPSTSVREKPNQANSSQIPQL